MSVGDIFDTNTYAHDPKGDFLNWSLIDAGAFDYAADAWGYSYGVAAEWTQDWWTLRAGLFDLSRVPNSTELETDFSQFEVGRRGGGAPRPVRPARARSSCSASSIAAAWDYRDAVALGAGDGHDARHRAGAPLFFAARRRRINIEQRLTDDLGLFSRLSLNDGSKEAYEFTEINRSATLGLSLKGA